MANRNFNGVQINQSSTIVEQAGEKIKDCRNRFMVYNANGNVALAVDGTKPIVGVALIESGLNDISGRDSGMVEAAVMWIFRLRISDMFWQVQRFPKVLR